MPLVPLLLRGESSPGGAYALHSASEGRVRLHASVVVAAAPRSSIRLYLCYLLRHQIVAASMHLRIRPHGR